MISLLAKEVFDLSIDTNMTFDISSALIALKAGIPSRMGLSKGFGSPFYNLGFWGDSVSELIKFWKEVT